MAKKKNEISIRSSDAEYLTYVVSVSAINQHLKKIFGKSDCKRLYHSGLDNGCRPSKEGYDVTDLCATAFDYDKDAKTTRRFFKTMQNKMHYATHRHTAAELIVERADAEKEHMGLYLDYAELQAERHIPMSMEDWAKRLDGFLEFNGAEILTGAGKISAEQAKLHAETEFEKYRVIQDRLFMSDYN